MASMSVLKHNLGAGSSSPGATYDQTAVAGYDLETVKPLDSRYRCGFCKFILRTPLQLSCGDRYCKVCSVTLLSKAPARCLLCDEILEQDGFKDTFAEREVQALVVFCGNKKVGCAWTGALRTYQDHKRDCSHQLELCCNEGCMQQLLQSDLALHQKSECVHRRVQCGRCGVSLKYHHLASHDSEECLMRQTLCRHCGKVVVASEMDLHLQKHCDDVLVDCEFAQYGCTEQVKRKDIIAHASNPNHMRYMMEDRQQLKNQVSALTGNVSMMQTDISDLRQLVMVMQNNTPARIADVSHPREQRVTELPRRHADFTDAAAGMVTVGTMQESTIQILEKVNSLELEILHLRKVQENTVANQRAQSASRDNGDDLPAVVKSLQGKVESNEKSIGYTDVRMADLGLRVDIVDVKSTDGVLVWKIGDIARRTREAVSGRTPSLYSAPFYTSNCGYKMCARIYLNGDGMGKGKCVSMFFVLMRGEYDALLPWPFQQRVTMVMLDQNEGPGIKRNIVEVFKPERRSASFQRPTSEMNTGSGCPMFALTNVLESTTYVKDDTIFIKVVVEKSGFDAPDLPRA